MGRWTSVDMRWSWVAAMFERVSRGTCIKLVVTEGKLA